jgi:uncharacterized protein (UPF0332 family)
MTERIVEVYLAKAADSLAGAESKYANGRYDNCANRAYYSCFQAAVAALLRDGIGAPGQAAHWSHDFVQARFIGDLINRRKRYPSTMRETLIQGLELRRTADYKMQRVSGIRASRGLARARTFVAAVLAAGGEQR